MTTDRTYATMSPRSRLLPAERPWLYRVGDVVRLESGECVQILDGFLHVRRGVGSARPSYNRSGSTVLLIRAFSEAAR